MSIERQLIQASIGILLEYPFFGHLLSEVVKEVDPGATDSICLRYEEPVFVLSVHPAFWRDQLRNRQEQMGCLYHQLLHLSFGHPWRLADFSDPFLANVAADLQANTYLPEAWRWPGALMAEDLRGWTFDPSATLAGWYEAVAALWAEGGESHPEAWSVLTAWYDERETLFESHRLWFDPAPESRSARSMARWSARSLWRQVERQTGADATAQLPGALRLALKERWAPPSQEIPWRKLLRQFAQSSRSTYLVETVHRPSKRYGSHPGVRVRRRQRLLVAVDTSGSVSREEQSAFFAEIRYLARTGAEVILLEFDADIQRVYPFRRSLPTFVIGGGGTNFLPVLEYANAQGPWDGVVVFTDGFAPIPRIGIRAPLLWVITAQGLSPATDMYHRLPGQKLKLRAGTEKSATFEI